jgi:hypothetical protein
MLANVQFGYLEATYSDHAEHAGSAKRVGILFAIMVGRCGLSPSSNQVDLILKPKP